MRLLHSGLVLIILLIVAGCQSRPTVPTNVVARTESEVTRQSAVPQPTATSQPPTVAPLDTASPSPTAEPTATSPPPTIPPTDTATPSPTVTPTATPQPATATPEPTPPPVTAETLDLGPQPNPAATVHNNTEIEPILAEAGALLAGGSIPAPRLFDIPWQDRSLFREGLIISEQDVLDELPGASIYRLDLEISDDLLNVSGQQEVLYTNREAKSLNEIYFRLFPNLANGSTTISNLTVNDQAVEPIFELQNSVMRVSLSSPLLPGEQVVIRMDFAVRIPNGEGGNYGAFAFINDVLALAHFYPMIAVYDDEGWNVEIAPDIGDVVYADMSFYLVRVAAPVDQTIVASGVEIAREAVNERQVVTIAAGPMRDFYLAASNRYTVVSQTVGQTTVNSYAPTELAAGAEAALGQAIDALQSFNKRFGTYPYTEFDLVTTTTFALGIEYPGLVAILVDLYNPDAQIATTPANILLEAVVAHEVVHQWFYGLVGNDQVDEPWLDEALAQFVTILYYSDVYGPNGSRGFHNSLQRRWSRVNGADIPIGLPVRDYSPEEYSAIVYGRGPLFIEALSQEMGAETFAAFLRDYFQTYQWDIATGEDFRALAEQHCQCDLTTLFEAWVYAQQE